jgi:hypothetical protein
MYRHESLKSGGKDLHLASYNNCFLSCKPRACFFRTSERQHHTSINVSVATTTVYTPDFRLPAVKNKLKYNVNFCLLLETTKSVCLN